MKKYLNTLYITTNGTYLHKERETIVVEVERKKVAQFPIHLIGNIFCLGRIMVSPDLMAFCGENGVGLAFFTDYGKFQARISGRVSGNVLLRREQYRIADDQTKHIDIVKNIIAAKISSSRTSLQRFLRNNQESQHRQQIKDVINRNKEILQSLQTLTTVNQIRGYEGEAAANYFSIFDHMILKNKKDFFFKLRNRRPPLDNVNALLSFLYTLILHDCISACEGIGLDPAVGFLHKDRPGRSSLALDLSEEFRAFISDRLVLSLINRQQISPKGFTITSSGAVRMDDKTRKIVITAYQDRKKEQIEHPFLKEKAHIGLLFHLQAQLLSRHIRGDIQQYPPFIWR